VADLVGQRSPPKQMQFACVTACIHVFQADSLMAGPARIICCVTRPQRAPRTHQAAHLEAMKLSCAHDQ
jgi:hypothetical protein